MSLDLGKSPQGPQGPQGPQNPQGPQGPGNQPHPPYPPQPHPPQPYPPQPARYPSLEGESLNIGEAISTVFSIFKERFALLWLIGFIGCVPNLVGDLILGASPEATLGSVQMISFWTSALVIASLLLNMCMQGAVCFCVYRSLRGEESTFGECLVKGLRRVPSLIALSFLLLLAFAGLFGFSALIVRVSHGVAGTAVSVVAMMAVIFFALVIILKVTLAVPVCVIEKAGALASLRRSTELTRGNLARIFVVLLLMSILCVVIFVVCMLPLGLMTITDIGYQVASAISWVFRAVPFVLGFICLPVMYCQLRAIKENHSVIDEADVFD